MVSIFSSAPFFPKYVKQLTPEDQTPNLHHLHGNKKLWPFFEKALGAIDGSHIHVTPPNHLRIACINRKGYTSQNCIFCCSFNLLFTYVLTGWEGSASDARVYQNAIDTDLVIPEG